MGSERRGWTRLRDWNGWALMVGFTLGTFTVTRILLLILSGASEVPAVLWPRIFLVGLWFDLLVVGVLLSPLLLARALFPGVGGPGFRRSVWFSLNWLLAFGLLLGVAAEVVFWQEFATRFNFIAVDYLLYTHEVIRNIWESYPVIWILAGVALLALGPAAFIGLAGRSFPVLKPSTRAGMAVAGLVLPVLGFGLGNVDHMYGSGNAFADELSGNGLMTFAAAARRNALDYERFYATLPQREADRILQGLGVERVPLEAVGQREEEGHAEPMGPLLRSPRHVVLVTVESLSASFLGCYGAPGGLTPHLDALAQNGYRFREVLATGTRTVRGLEALSLGVPPVPGQAIVRRPGNAHLSTLGELMALQGFSVSFVYGGYGYFDNMNSYFRGNDYRVIDRRDFPSGSVGFENAWGVSDEFLFDNALGELDAAAARGERFFSHIMTTTNHRPFTYPEGRIDVPSPGGREGAVKYSDHAIGRFIEAARAKPWFKDTLFIFTADHCASVAGRTRLPVAKYRIPMIWYGPGLVKPGVHEARISQIDLPPTLLDVLGLKGDDCFFGLSVFEHPADLQRAFISNYQALGYLRGDHLMVLLPKQQVQAFRVDPATLESTPEPVDPRLKQEAIAYYQTAARAFKLGRLAAPSRASLAARADRNPS